MGALGLTIAIAAVAIGVLPTPTGVSPASAGTEPAALQSSRLAVIEMPEPEPEPVTLAVAEEPAPPAESGQGRRIVFDQTDQRVWLIEAGETVVSTYLVSGSRFDNLRPGTYAVQSRSRHATSFDYSGTMEYFVRFTTGWRAPIGFHSIPVYNNGEPEQTLEELGTPLSAGCIRQAEEDAKRLWDFAPVGTKVIVTA